MKTRSLVIVAGLLLSLIPAATAGAWSYQVNLPGQPLMMAQLGNPADPAAPGAPGRDRTINNHLNRLIRSAGGGESIWGAVHDIELESGVMDSLKYHRSRGGGIGVVQDRLDTPSMPYHLGSGLVNRCARFGETAKSPCNGNSRNGMMHSKVFTLSSATDDWGTRHRDVTWVGSHNVVDGGGGAASFNDSLTVYGDPALWQGLTKIVRHMWDWRTTGGPWWGGDYLDVASGRGYVYSPASNVQVWASPQAGTDVWGDRLSEYTPGPGCVVRVMQHRVERRTSNASAGDAVSQLVRLKRGGCDVEVLLARWPDGSERVDASSFDALRAAGVGMRLVGPPMHDKLMIVYANRNGSAEKNWDTLTGSHNLTEHAAHDNDELLLRINQNGTALFTFLHHWQTAHDAPGGLPIVFQKWETPGDGD
jgi:hypothetical protein